MSTVIRDARGERVDATPRRADTSQREWPDRHEMMPPPVAAGRVLRAAKPMPAQWPDEMPEYSWPPLPDAERHARAPRRAELPANDPVAPPVTGRGPVRPAPGPARRVQPESDLLEPDHRAEAPTIASLEWTIPDAAEPRGPVNDPSPSRLSYRLNRLWLTPMVRHFVRIGLPVMLIAAFAGGWFSQEENRTALVTWVEGVKTTIQNQPMFEVSSMDVQARSPEVAEGVAQMLGVSFPVSSWDLDLGALRARAEELDAVERAWLQVRTGGVLEVRVTERVPAMVWRNAGGLDLVDATGHRVARLATRAARADLPLIAGDGAPEAIAEARALLASAAPILPRIRGLVRVGNRRWDVVLDRNQRIQLPATGAVPALELVVAMTEGAQQLLSRDVTVVDMRNPDRPTLRLTEDAMAELTRNRTLARGAPTR
ncbi:cell division protein FtsQ/DivIB [Pararhodobacter zhoushanensis]|uniref:cell division protein FtsQ/DivIB n=1 Tax=Pararhodobacter zhoushanensis TaxID=2479545 RepID=UPI001FE8ED4F|nr:cell division protein FtsQ/DivIB [Pararhodobacter zhoushanensis]